MDVQEELHFLRVHSVQVIALSAHNTPVRGTLSAPFCGVAVASFSALRPERTLQQLDCGPQLRAAPWPPGARSAPWQSTEPAWHGLRRCWQIFVLRRWWAMPRRNSDCIWNPVTHLELKENLHSHVVLFSGLSKCLLSRAIFLRSVQDQIMVSSPGSPHGYFGLKQFLFRFAVAFYLGRHARRAQVHTSLPHRPPRPPPNSLFYIGRDFWHSFFLLIWNSRICFPFYNNNYSSEKKSYNS